MRVSVEEARRIAALAHLEFDVAGLERIAAELTEILTYVDQLREADLGSGEGSVATAGTPMREDIPLPSLDHDLAAGNAPEWREGFFVVPRVIGGGS